MAPVAHPTGVGTASHGRRRSLGLDEDLDNAKLTFVEYLIQFGHILEWNPMGDHERRIELPGNDVILQDLVPIQVNGSYKIMGISSA